jgi:hypothetical protein
MTKTALALVITFCVVVELSVPVAASGKAAPLRSEPLNWTVLPPELILTLGANRRPLRFSVARLERMTRSAVSIADRNGKRLRTIEGVDISWLTFAGRRSEGGGTQVTVQTLRRDGEFLSSRGDGRCLEISYGLFRKKRIPFSEMDGDTRVIIIDRAKRRTLPIYAPFRLVVATGQGRTLLLNHVTRILVTPSP